MENTIKTKEEKYALLAEEIRKAQTSVHITDDNLGERSGIAADYQLHEHDHEEERIRDGSDAEDHALINSKNGTLSPIRGHVVYRVSV